MSTQRIRVRISVARARQSIKSSYKQLQNSKATIHQEATIQTQEYDMHYSNDDRNNPKVSTIKESSTKSV
jgi:hypothetical protein